MKVGRRRGSVRLHLDAVEVALLVRMMDELDAAIGLDAESVDHDDVVYRRLFPAGYGEAPEDAEASAEFRDLTESSLRELKLDRTGQCRAELAGSVGADVTEPVDLALDADAGGRWLTVLNDLRLALGARLDVQEDDEFGRSGRIDPDDPQGEARMIYLWLTALQDRLVQAVGSV